MQRNTGIQWPAVIILLIAGGGLGIALLATAGFLGAGIYSVFNGGSVEPQTVSMFSLGWASALVVLLLLPAIWFSIKSLMNAQPAGAVPTAPASRRLAIASAFLLLWPLLVLAGRAVIRSTDLEWLLLPPLQVLVVIIPLWWFLEIGLNGIRVGSSRRSWGLLSFGLVVTPFWIIIVELVVLVAIGGLVIVWLAMQPDVANELNRLSTRLMNSGMDPEVALRMLRPYLQRPLVVFGIVSIFSVVIPMIEEIFKPLAVWGLVGRVLTPREGFAAGLICGFAFGLFESLGTLSNPVGDAWVFTVIGRFGTGLLHTLTAGLVGWGMASAWNKSQYLRLGSILLIAITLHGLWNTFSILLGLSEGIGLNTAAVPGFALELAARLAAIAPFGLGILTTAMLLILIGSNRILRRQAAG